MLIRIAFALCFLAAEAGEYRVQREEGICRRNTSHDKGEARTARSTGPTGTAAQLRARSLSRRRVLRTTREGERRWPRSMREARPAGQAGRADLLLGGDPGPRGSVVEGGNQPGQA